MSDFFKESDCNGYGTYKCDDLAEIACIVDRGTMISLDKANRLVAEFLSKGTVVYGTEYNVVNANTQADKMGTWFHHKNAGKNEPGYKPPTHRALLINIEPIVKDSLEKLTIDMLTTIENGRGMLEIELERFKDRARKLLFQAADTER